MSTPGDGLERLLSAVFREDEPGPELLARYASDPHSLSPAKRREIERAMKARPELADELRTLRSFRLPDAAESRAPQRRWRRLPLWGGAAAAAALLFALTPSARRWLEGSGESLTPAVIPTAQSPRDAQLAAPKEPKDAALAQSDDPVDRDRKGPMKASASHELRTPVPHGAVEVRLSASSSLEDVIQTDVEVEPGKTVLLKPAYDVGDAAVANSAIADFVVHGANEIQLTAKSAGTTNLLIYDQNNRLQASIDIRVGAGLATSSPPVPGSIAMLEPTYRRPAEAPDRRRLAVAMRGPAAGGVGLEVLAPEHVARTGSAAPELFWKLSSPSPEGASLLFRIVEERSGETLVETELPVPATQAVQRVRLADLGATLQPGIVYSWFVVLRTDPENPARDQLAQGWIERREADATTTSEPGARPAELAQAGLWYDALAAALDLRAQEPSNPSVESGVRALLAQAGLSVQLEP